MGNNQALGQQGQGGGAYDPVRDDVSVEIVDQEVMRRQRKQATYPRPLPPLNLHKRELTPQQDALKINKIGEQSKNIDLSPVVVDTSNKSADFKANQFRIMGQNEFDYWKRKANAMAVEALKNSDSIAWPEFKSKLLKALQYYERTPGFNLLYRDSSISEKGILVSQDNGYKLQKIDEEKKQQILQMFKTMKFGAKDSQGPLYIDEIFRIQKSKGVIVRALIQNLYIQMQGSFVENNDEDSTPRLYSQSKSNSNEKQPNQKFVVQMEELMRYLLQFTDINNLTVQFVVEQLGEQHIQPVNLAALSANSADSRKILRQQKSKAVSERFRHIPMGRINDPGPGGSPNDIQESSSVNIVSPRNLLNGSRDNRTPKSCSPAAITSKEVSEPAPIWCKRYIEALQSCQFLFQDKFIKSLLQNEKDYGNKLHFLKTIYNTINPYNHEYLRKISWYISKTLYKKAVYEQNRRELETSDQDNQQAALFLTRFEDFTLSIEENQILSDAKFLAQDNFNDITGDEVEKHRVRIDNLQNIITYLIQNQKVISKTDKSQTSSQNLKQFENQTPSRQKQSQDLLEQTPSQMQINQPDQTSSKDRSNMTSPPIVTASQPIDNLVDPPLQPLATHVSQPQLTRVRTRRLSSYERESARPEQYRLKRQDTTPIDRKQRSPLSKLSRTPEAQVVSDGDLAVDLEEEEAAVFVQNINVQPQVRSRADTGSSIAEATKIQKKQSREDQNIQVQEQQNIKKSKARQDNEEQSPIIEASSAPETNIDLSNNDQKTSNNQQRVSQITKILVEQPILNAESQNFNLDQQTPSSDATAAILSIELANKKKPIQVKAGSRKSKKSNDKTLISDASMQPLTERSKAVKEAERLRAQQLELSKALLPQVKHVKSISKISKNKLSNTEKQLLKATIVKLPDADKNEVLSDRPNRTKSRSRTPRAQLKDRLPPNKGPLSPTINMSKPSILNSTQTQYQINRRKIITEKSSNQLEDLSTIKGQPVSYQRIRKSRLNRKSTNSKDVTLPKRPMSPKPVNSRPMSPRAFSPRPLSPRPMSPRTKANVKVKKPPAYLTEPAPAVQSPQAQKQRRKENINQKSFASPLKLRVNQKPKVPQTHCHSRTSTLLIEQQKKETNAKPIISTKPEKQQVKIVRPQSPIQRSQKNIQKDAEKKTNKVAAQPNQQKTKKSTTNIVVNLQTDQQNVVQAKFVEPQVTNQIIQDQQEEITRNASPMFQGDSQATSQNTAMAFQTPKIRTQNRNRNTQQKEDAEEPKSQTRKHKQQRQMKSQPDINPNSVKNVSKATSKKITEESQKQIEKAQVSQAQIQLQFRGNDQINDTGSVKDANNKLIEESKTDDCADMQTWNLVDASIRISTDKKSNYDKSEITTGKANNQYELQSREVNSESLPQSEKPYTPQDPFIAEYDPGVAASDQEGVSRQVEQLQYQFNQDQADIEPQTSSQSANRTSQMDPTRTSQMDKTDNINTNYKEAITEQSKKSNLTSQFRNQKKDNNETGKSQNILIQNQSSKIVSQDSGEYMIQDSLKNRPSLPIETKPKQNPQLAQIMSNNFELLPNQELDRQTESPRFPVVEKKFPKKLVIERAQTPKKKESSRRLGSSTVQQFMVEKTPSDKKSVCQGKDDEEALQEVLKDCMKHQNAQQHVVQKKSSKVQRSSLGISEKDFEPLMLLGSGSFGDVFLVRYIKDQGGAPGPLYAMKALQKRSNKDEAWLRYIKNERDVMAYSDNPFICKLQFAFQTINKLFLVMDFCPGGDLEIMMENEKALFSEQKAKFYIAEILLALQDLHSRNIIYRDLKPDNVVIDEQGHARLIDFGMTKNDVTESTTGAKTFCGSIKYLAPEMLKKTGHGQALDWYLLGVLLFEMIMGVTPYYSNNKETLFNNILYGNLKFPRSVSPELKDLLTQLLKRAPEKRLGSQPGEFGAKYIMSHAFFKDIDWKALMEKRQTETFNFWPQPSEQSVNDYQIMYQKTQLSPSELYYVYNAEDDDEEGEDDWTEDRVEDDDISGILVKSNTMIKSTRSGIRSQTWRQESDDFQNYVEDWDFIRTPKSTEQQTDKNKQQAFELINKAQFQPKKQASQQKSQQSDLRKPIRNCQTAKPDDTSRKSKNAQPQKKLGILK